MTARVGQPAPQFEVQAYDRTKDNSDKQFTNVKLSDYSGKWVCLFFYPLDFTFVCPTELLAFNEKVQAFADRKCVLLTASTDSVYSHKGSERPPISDAGGHESQTVVGLRCPGRKHGHCLPRHLPDRSERGRSLAGRARPGSRPECGRSPASSRCSADRKTCSLQLEAGR